MPARVFTFGNTLRLSYRDAEPIFIRIGPTPLRLHPEPTLKIHRGSRVGEEGVFPFKMKNSGKTVTRFAKQNLSM